MANPTSALIPWHNQDEHRTVALRSNCQVAVVDMNLGPGRLLNQAYSASGRWVEKGLGLAGHKLGMGPLAVSRRIEKAFGDDSLTRQSKLDNIYDSFQKGTNTQKDQLNKECQKLLEYALPSQSPVTQVETFKQIIKLTTRYPGLRRLFLQSPDIGRLAYSPDAICEFCRNREHDYDKESSFLLNFAANCLARIEPNIELEGIRPSELGCTSEKAPGVVERLVARHCDFEEGSRFPRLIAIRYIATTLELPAFWSENYEIQKITMDILCKQTLIFIEDIDPDSVNASDFESTLFDPDGIDAVAEAILVGGKHWLQQQPRISESGPPYWLASFVKLIKKLRGLILPNLLPMAFRRAEEDWEALLKVVKHELPMSSLDQFEDVYAFVTECSGILPSFMKPSDVTEDLPNSDSKGFPFFEASKTQDKDSAPVRMLEELSEGDRQIVQMETVKLAEMIFMIEYNFNDVERRLQKVDTIKIIRVNLKLEMCSPDWIKLHHEYTALVHNSQRSANEVQSRIRNLLDIIRTYGEDNQELEAHLASYTNDLRGFQDNATPIQTRFLRLSQDVDAFRSNLKDVFALENKSEVEEIDRQIQELRAELFSTSALFVNWWETKRTDLEVRNHRYLAAVGIAGLAPHTAAKHLLGELESIGFPVEGALKNQIRRRELKKRLRDCHKQKVSLTLGPRTLRDVERIIAGFDGIFEDTIGRLYAVQAIWQALRMDVLTLQAELGSSSDLESRNEKVSHFERLYEVLWFALDKYILEFAKTEKSPVHPEIIERPPFSFGALADLFKRF